MIPVQNGQIVTRLWPDDSRALRLQFLELHGDLSFLDFVVGESLEMRGESELHVGEYEPFRRIPTEGGGGVSVVGGEFVVEAENKGSENQSLTGGVEERRLTCGSLLRE